MIDIIFFILLLALSIVLSVFICKRSADKGYRLRGVSSIFFSVFIIGLSLLFGNLSFSIAELLYAETSKSVMLSVYLPMILLLAVCALSLLKRKYISLIISVALTVGSAITLCLIFKNHQLFSVFLPVTLLISGAVLFTITNIYLSTEKKAEKISLVILNVIFTALFAIILFKFYEVGINIYKTGENMALGGAMAVLIPATVIYALPPLISIFTIISKILKDSNS